MDHVAEALARRPQRMKSQTVRSAYLAIWVGPLQDVEDAMQSLLTGYTIRAAVGDQLDVLGDLVGEPRNGETDDEVYRRRVRTRIVVNRSRGTTEDLIKVSRQYLGDSAYVVDVDTVGAAAAVVRLTGAEPTDAVAAVLARFLGEGKSGGVRLILEYLTVDEEDSFTLATATILNGALVGAETTIPVASTADFPTSGTLVLGVGLASEEEVTYTGTTATSFLGCSAVAGAHVDDTEVQWKESPGLGCALMTPLDGAHGSGATTLTVASTTGFPSSGSLVLDDGTALEELVTYSGKTGTTFTGVSATVNAHADDSSVTSTAYGGQTINAIEATP